MNLQHYETTFILKPTLSPHELEQHLAKVLALLQERGTIVAQEPMQLHPLAYPIDKHHQGFYQTIEFTAPAGTVAILETEYTRNEHILHFLTLALDKHGIAYHRYRRAQAAAANSQPETQETEEPTEDQQPPLPL